MNKYNYKSHILGCMALFTMGNAFIILPFYKAENPLFVFMLTAALTSVFVIICAALSNFAFGGKEHKFKKIISRIVAALTLLAAFYGVGSTFFDYVSFVKHIQMPKTASLLVTAALLGLCVLFVKCKNGALLKTGLFLAVLTQVSVLLLIAVSVKLLDFGEIGFNVNLTASDIGATNKYFLKYFSPVLSATVFVTLINKKASPLNILGGTALGLVNIFAALAQSIAVLGVASGYEFSYFYAANAFSSGDLFYRLGGIVYFIFFAAAVIKIAICIKTVFLIIKNLRQN